MMGLTEALGYMGFVWGVPLAVIAVCAFLYKSLVKCDWGAAIGFGAVVALGITFIGGFQELGVTASAFGR